MVRIAIVGHRGLSNRTMDLVRQALLDELAAYDAHALEGLSCLADGADQLFAEIILSLGGTLTAIIPAKEFRNGLPPECWPTYDDLLSRSTRIIEMDATESAGPAHMIAGERMLEEADIVFAVWDGEPARGVGGTADIIEAANRRGLSVYIIWPAGASRD